MLLVPFELRPSMPDEGLKISELEASGHSDHVAEHLMHLAEREGFDLVIPGFLPKTHKALVLGEMARDLGEKTHWNVHHAIFHAYFGEGRDIGQSQVLLEIAQEHGLAVEAVERAWEEGEYDERIRQFQHVGFYMGIDSTPAALVCNELLIGSRPYAAIKEALDRCLLRPEAIEEPGDERANAAGQDPS